MTTVTSRRAPARSAVQAPPRWSFLTNYALVLVYVVIHPESTVRNIAAGIGITERATLAILRDLDVDAIVDRRRDGRRNVYTVNFRRLSSVRRGGVSNALTPRLFVDVVVKMLFDLYPPAPGEAPEPPRSTPPDDLEERAGSWGFFTNHMLVLLAAARDPSQTVRELSASIGITERATVGILNQLEAERIIVRHREGRRNRYTIDFGRFRAFRGWSFTNWRVPAPLIDVAANGIRALGAR